MPRVPIILRPSLPIATEMEVAQRSLGLIAGAIPVIRRPSRARPSVHWCLESGWRWDVRMIHIIAQVKTVILFSSIFPAHMILQIFISCFYHGLRSFAF